MKIRLPKFIGRKLYIKYRSWEIRQQFTIRPVIRIEINFYTYPMKTRNYGKVPYIGVKYCLVIGGREKKMKRYCVYIEIPDNNVCIKYGYRRFKFTAWLLAKEAKKTWYDIETVIYDRKKGEIIHEK